MICLNVTRVAPLGVTAGRAAALAFIPVVLCPFFSELHDTCSAQSFPPGHTPMDGKCVFNQEGLTKGDKPGSVLISLSDTRSYSYGHFRETV